MDLFTAITIGLIGSLHCAGMCGPIAIALPLAKESWLKKISGGLFYNFGRIITYGVLGALFGLLGRGIKIAGLQQWASIAIGIIMIISVLFPFIFREKIKIDNLFSGYQPFNRRIQETFYKGIFGISVHDWIIEWLVALRTGLCSHCRSHQYKRCCNGNRFYDAIRTGNDTYVAWYFHHGEHDQHGVEKKGEQSDPGIYCHPWDSIYPSWDEPWHSLCQPKN